MRRGGFKEAKGLPQKTGPAFPMGDRIKAACLDENALISTITELAPAKKEMVAQLLRQHLERLQLIQD